MSCKVHLYISDEIQEIFKIMKMWNKPGTFKQTAAQRSKRYSKVHSSPLDGTVQKCVLYDFKCTSDYSDNNLSYSPVIQVQLIATCTRLFAVLSCDNSLNLKEGRSSLEVFWSPLTDWIAQYGPTSWMYRIWQSI